MKYNKSEIMKRAWKTYKFYQLDGYKGYTFSKALSDAWHTAKRETAQAETLNSLVGSQFKNNMEITVGYKVFGLSRWTQHGHDRVYINGHKTQGSYIDLKTRRLIKKGKGENQERLAEIVLSMAF